MNAMEVNNYKIGNSSATTAWQMMATVSKWQQTTLISEKQQHFHQLQIAKLLLPVNLNLPGQILPETSTAFCIAPQSKSLMSE